MIHSFGNIGASPCLGQGVGWQNRGHFLAQSLRVAFEKIFIALRIGKSFQQAHKRSFFARKMTAEDFQHFAFIIAQKELVFIDTSFNAVFDVLKNAAAHLQ